MNNTVEQCTPVFDILENGTMILDDECTVLLWNKWLEINTGIASKEITGKKLEQFYSQIDYKSLQRKIKTSLKLNTPTFYDASLSNRFISIPRNKVTATYLETMQLQVTISPYMPHMKSVMVSIHDISDLHELKLELEKQMERIAALNMELEQEQAIIDANLMIVKTDPFWNIISITESFSIFSGYSLDFLGGKSLQDFFANETRELNESYIVESLNQKKRCVAEIQIQINSGEVIWLDMTVLPHEDGHGDMSSQTVIFHDISDKKRIEFLSNIDPLTKIFNRQKFNSVFSKMRMRQHWSEEKSFGLVIADVDHFKSVNDTYGHQVGDKVLVLVADTLQQTLRSGDILARWGGEEFVVILPDVNIEQVLFVAEKLRQAVQATVIESVGNVTASFGVTLFEQGDNEETMMYRADVALYRAKKNGRNRIEVTK